jgi:hypothetical protein
VAGHTPWAEIKRKRAFTVRSESPRINLDEDVLGLAHEYLQATAPAAGAAAVLDHERGTLSVTMQVEANREDEAREQAKRLLLGALEAAGFDTSKPGWRIVTEIIC